jgi:hypothetical protein
MERYKEDEEVGVLPLTALPIPVMAGVKAFSGESS